MQAHCERCGKLENCKWYGSPADIENDKAQSGEWLCYDCVVPRLEEVNKAIQQLEYFME